LVPNILGDHFYNPLVHSIVYAIIIIIIIIIIKILQDLASKYI